MGTHVDRGAPCNAQIADPIAQRATGQLVLFFSSSPVGLGLESSFFDDDPLIAKEKTDKTERFTMSIPEQEC